MQNYAILARFIALGVLAMCAAAAPLPGHPLLSLRPGTWWVAPNSTFGTSGILASISDNPNLRPNPLTFGRTGGAFDPVRSLLFFTGAGLGADGSNDNSLYAFDVHNLTWTRFWGPEGILNTNNSQIQFVVYDANNNSLPAARYTRDGMDYDPINGEIVTVGGEYYPSGTSTHTWTFNLVNRTWTRMNDFSVQIGPAGTLYGTMLGHDTLRGKMLALGQYLFHVYDPVARNVTSQAYRVCGTPAVAFSGLWNYQATGSAVPGRRLFHAVGGGAQYLLDTTDIFNVCLYNRSQPEDVGGSPGLILARSPGVDVWPVNQTLVGYTGDGAGTFIFNKDTFQWKYVPPAPENTVIPVSSTIYGRWRYVPDYDVFIYAPERHLPVYFYKMGVPASVTSCNSAQRPQDPYPDAWDCVNGTWVYVATLTIYPQKPLTILYNVTVQGDLSLGGQLVVGLNTTLRVEGCIILTNGSSFDLKFDPLTFEDASKLVGTNYTIAVSTTGCIQNPIGLTDGPIIIARGSTPCQQVSATVVADEQRGSLSVVVRSSSGDGCLVELQSSGIPTWAIGLIVAIVIAIVGTIIILLAIPATRRRIIPSYRMNLQLKSFVRKSLHQNA